MKRLSHNANFFPKSQAVDLAHKLNSDREDDWTYDLSVAYVKEGMAYYRIQVRDETGFAVGCL